MPIWGKEQRGRKRTLEPVQGAACVHHFGRAFRLSQAGISRTLGCQLDSVRGWRAGEVRMSAAYLTRMVYVLAMVANEPNYWREDRLIGLHWGTIERHKYGLPSRSHPLFPALGYGRHALPTIPQTQVLVQYTLSTCDISVSDLARCLGTETRTVTNWRSGKRAIQPAYLGKLLWLWLCRTRDPGYWDPTRLRNEFGFPSIESHPAGLGNPPRARRARNTARAAAARELDGAFFHTLEEAQAAARRVNAMR